MHRWNLQPQASHRGRSDEVDHRIIGHSITIEAPAAAVVLPKTVRCARQPGPTHCDPLGRVVIQLQQADVTAASRSVSGRA